jgi:hypothetical protein
MANATRRILVVNDDGWSARGLLALVAAVATLPDVEVYVAAPSTERSATGHGITVFAPLIAAPVTIPGAREAYAISGLPADCTMLALAALFPVRTPQRGLRTKQAARRTHKHRPGLICGWRHPTPPRSTLVALTWC